MTFNHGVEGSSPSALTNRIKHLGTSRDFRKSASVGTVLANRLRNAGPPIMDSLTDLEKVLLAACQMALRQLEYDGDDKTAFAGAVFEALRPSRQP